jgi:hypothetical protein
MASSMAPDAFVGGSITGNDSQSSSLLLVRSITTEELGGGVLDGTLLYEIAGTVDDALLAHLAEPAPGGGPLSLQTEPLAS